MPASTDVIGKILKHQTCHDDLSESVEPAQLQLQNGLKVENAHSLLVPSSRKPCPPPQFHHDPIQGLGPRDMVEELERNHRTLTHRFFFIRDYLRPGIPVFKDGSKTYELQSTRLALNHDDEEDPSYDPFTIISDPSMDPNCDHVVMADYDPSDPYSFDFEKIDCIAPDRARVFSMPLSLEAGNSTASVAKLIPCVFIALGWLSEPSENFDLDKRTSYYVVLLNLSTAPVSVWLMHDYHSCEHLACKVRWTNLKVGDGNPLFVDGNIGSIVAGNDSSNHLLDRYKDFRQRYTNEADMRPQENAYKTTTPDHKHVCRAFADVESLSNRSQISAHSYSAESADRDPKFAGIASITPPDSVTADDDSILPATQGQEHADTCCPNSNQSFDLAMLAPDVDKWDPSNGLDLKEVKVCLHATSMRLGSSLRIREATNEEKSHLSTNKRVDLRALCSG
ncbi:MAG: hypothetical protein Q9207_004488 [Kuettlingeria erythrocarpa]